jgi:C4-dicarboxylate-specific signal transduction histidine kinase
VRSLRAVSRAGTNDPFTSAPISQILSDTEELCVEKLKKFGINFSTKKNVDFETGIECRPVQVVQVLLNVINNACDAIKDLDTKWITLDVEQQGDLIEFRITDSGAGIPVNIADKLFSPFFTTKSYDQGSGIGLNVSKRIVESHGGTITLNRENKNTQFVINFPIIQRAGTKAA